MASSTEIANLALSHLGVGVDISNLESDSSAEAKACRRFYDTSLQATLRDFAWPFATKVAALALIEEDPTTEWDYSYRYPSDCLSVRKILSGIRMDARNTRVPYRIAQDAAGRVIYSDEDDAVMEYTVLEEDAGIYPPDFVLALSYRLASYIVPRVTAGDPFKLRQTVMQLYAFELSNAQANSFNEEQADENPDSEFIRVRE